MSDQSSDSSKDPNKKTAKLTPPTPNQTAKLGDLPSVEPSIEPSARKRRRLPLLIGVAFVLLILFSGVGFATATALENQDSFCISCHTVPETTYYNRAYVALDNPSNASTVTDLVTAHYHLSQANGKAPFACIECHRGNAGIVDRVAAIALGAKDTAVWVLGAGGDPTIEKPADPNGIWLTDAACISCHADTLLKVDDINNHYHTKLPETAQLVASGRNFVLPGNANSGTQAVRNKQFAAWETPVDVPLNCSSCHVAHKTMPNGTTSKFTDQQIYLTACQSCHVAAGQGPVDLTTGTQ